MHSSGEKRTDLQNHVTAALITLFFCVFILPLNEHIAFRIPSDRATLVLACLLKLGFAVFFYLATYFVINFIQKLQQGDRSYARWLKYSAVYFAIMMMFLLLVYPGNWLWDEFLIFRMVKAYSTYSWQNYFTNVYYTFSLYIIPTAVAIVFFQCAIISLIVGYIATKGSILFRHERLARWLFLPFFFIPIIYYNLYPLRLTLYSYLELLLIFKLIQIHLRPQSIHNRYLTLVALAFLITLVSFWRTEGVYYLLILPYLAYKLDLLRASEICQTKTWASLLTALTIVILGYSITKATASPSYQLSTTLNPLSTMLQQPLKGDQIPQKLQTIDKVVDLKFLKANPDYYEVPVFWYDNTIRPGYQKYLTAYNQAAFYIISHNLNSYLYNRLVLFLGTNTFGGPIPQVGEGGLRFFDTRPDRKEVVDYFLSTNYLSHPIDSNLKQLATRLFLGINRNNESTFASHLIWNIIPIVLLVAALCTWKLFHKAYFWAFLASLVLARFALLVFTSPASYFMYYLPVYMSGSFLITLASLMYIDTQRISISIKPALLNALHKREAER